jgi:hypothetical protein
MLKTEKEHKLPCDIHNLMKPAGRYFKILNIIQLLYFWTLSIVLFLFKTYSESETGFCLRLQVKTIQLGPIDISSPYLRAIALAIGLN